MNQHRNPRRVKALIATMAAFFWIASASATTYYLNVSEASKSYSGWTTLDNWSTTAGTTGDDNHPTSFSSEDEFVVPPYSGGFTLRTMSTQATWSGKCLRIGGEPHLNNTSFAILRHERRGDTTSLTYENDGLILGDRSRYYVYYGNAPSHVYGKVTVASTNELRAAQMYSAYQDGATVRFHDAFYGESNVYFRIVNSKVNFTVMIDNPTAYYGTITSTNEAGNLNNNSLVLGGDFPGTLSLAGATTLFTSDGCKINSLSLGAGAVIDATAGAFSVTGAFENASVVTVRVDTARFPGTVDLVSGSVGMFTLDDFVFTDSTGAPLVFLDSLSLVETANGIVIRAFQYPTATLTTADSSSRTTEGDSSMTNATHWSNAESWPDSATMPGGVHYALSSSAKYLRTAYSGTLTAPVGNFEFPGVSLTLPSATYLLMLNPSFACTNLVLDGGQLQPSLYTDTTFSGKMTVTENGGSIYQYIRKTTVESEISGPGNLRLTAASGSATSQPYGTVCLAGLNTNFTGAVTATIPIYTPNDLVANTNKITPRFDKNYMHLQISDKRNLGGPLVVVNPKALTLQNMSRLEITEGFTSLTLDEPTRGVFVKWVGRFLADSGQTMTLASPLAVYGTMWKEGEGTLVLANPQPTFGASATATMPDVEATNRTLRVAAGTVRVAAGCAVNGLDVVVADGATLALDLTSGDADVAAYGIRNDRTPGTPFAVDGAAANVYLDLVPPADYEGANEVPVVTVKATDADSVDALLVVRKPTDSGRMRTLAKSRKSVTIDETACVTFTVNTLKHGLVFTIK